MAITMQQTPGKVVRVNAYRLAVFDERWAFADSNAEAIAAHWQRRKAENANFFNGAIHLLHRYALVDEIFTAELFRTDFASYLYWRENDYPDKSVSDCFGSALLRSGDGKVILGRQAPGNVNSGLTYLPGGFIDKRDVGPDRFVDIAGSVSREIFEELGFVPGTFMPRPGAYLTFHDALISIAIEFVCPKGADDLLALARRHIAAESKPELEDVSAVATLADLQGLAMPGYASTLLRSLLPAT